MTDQTRVHKTQAILESAGTVECTDGRRGTIVDGEIVCGSWLTPEGPVSDAGSSGGFQLLLTTDRRLPADRDDLARFLRAIAKALETGTIGDLTESEGGQ